jgi:preprotein translocase subunit SecD
MIMRRKFARLSVPVWVVVLALLLMAMPDVQPSAAETSSAIDQTHSLGRIEIVDGGTQFLPIGAEVKTGPQANPDQDVYQAVLTSADFVSAEALTNDKGRPVIEFTLTPTGDARLAAFSARLPTYYLCLTVDGQVVNCPILRTPLVNRGGTIELTGNATLDDARALAMSLRSGQDW